MPLPLLQSAAVLICWLQLLQERLQSATSAVQALDDEVSKQLHYIRADVKQAITVANSKLQADIETAAQARQQEDAAQLKAQLKGEVEQHMGARARLHSCALHHHFMFQSALKQFI
jgi:hypothetical protein